jgi:hypothetical protein
MIEREAPIKIYNELLVGGGGKFVRGKLVRVAEGFYEVTIEQQDRSFTTLLPIGSTVIMAAEAEEVVATLDVER